MSRKKREKELIKTCGNSLYIEIGISNNLLCENLEKIDSLYLSGVVTKILNLSPLNLDNLKFIYFDKHLITNCYLFNGFVSTIQNKILSAPFWLTSSSFPSINTTDNGDGTFNIVFSNINNICDEAEIDFAYDKSSIYRIKKRYQISSGTIKDRIHCDIFGKYNDCIIKLYKNNEIISSETFNYLVVTNSVYNFAFLNATYPTLYFFSFLDELVNCEFQTYLLIERNKDINFENYYKNLYKLPVIGENEWNNSSYLDNCISCFKYIKELYNLNNKSIFNFYGSDGLFDILLNATFLNGININNFNINVLSDGSLTFILLKRLINKCNTEKDFNNRLNKMRKEIEKFLLNAKEYMYFSKLSINNKYYKTNKFFKSFDKFNIGEYVIPFCSIYKNIKYYLPKEYNIECSDEIKLVLKDFVSILNLNVKLLSLNYDKKNVLLSLFKLNVNDCKGLDNAFVFFDNQFYDIFIEQSLILLSALYELIKIENKEFKIFYKGKPTSIKRREIYKIDLVNRLNKLNYNFVLLNSDFPAELLILLSNNFKFCGFPTTIFQLSDRYENFFALIGTSKSEASKIEYLENPCSFKYYLSFISSREAKKIFGRDIENIVKIEANHNAAFNEAYFNLSENKLIFK